MILLYFLFVCVLWNERTVLSAKDFDKIDENVQAIRSDRYFTPEKFEGKCPVDEIFYPDDEQGDRGECDCFPGHLYHPQSRRCYDAEGIYETPCGENQHLTLPFNSSFATCVPKPCKGREKSINQGKCYLVLPPGCASLPHHFMSINFTTITLDCLNIYEVQLELNSYHKFCWKGGKRWLRDKCKGKNTKPFDLPGCPSGELYYPGDKPGEWRCDCKPGYIYHSDSDACYAAYTRGPCSGGEHFVFPLGYVYPICIRSQCPSENHVFFRSKCHPFRTFEPCSPELKFLSVNSTTLKLECTTPKLYRHDYELDKITYVP